VIKVRKRNASAMTELVGATEFPSREQRVHVNIPAAVRVAAERTVTARIVDLSVDGFRLVSDEALELGQQVEVASRKAVSGGRICWVNGNQAGGIFADRPETLD
jgi:hypothetical protein